MVVRRGGSGVGFAPRAKTGTSAASSASPPSSASASAAAVGSGGGGGTGVRVGVGEGRSCISLAALLRKTHPGGNDLVLGPKPTFVDLVRERADELAAVLRRLGHSADHVADLRFPPGQVLEELSALVARKTLELEKQQDLRTPVAPGSAASDQALLGGSGGKPCLAYIRGECALESTRCSLSHSAEAVALWCADHLQSLLAAQAADAAAAAAAAAASAWATPLLLAGPVRGAAAAATCGSTGDAEDAAAAADGATPSAAASHAEDAEVPSPQGAGDGADVGSEAATVRASIAGDVVVGAEGEVEGDAGTTAAAAGGVAGEGADANPHSLTLVEPLGKEAFRTLLGLVGEAQLRTLRAHALGKLACKTLCRALAAARLAGLSTLDLAGCGIGAAHPTTLARLAAAVRPCPSLTSLGLGGNALGTKGLLTVLVGLYAPPCGSTTLAALDVSHNGITLDADVDAVRVPRVAEALEAHCAALTALDLSGNPLGAAGGRLMGRVLAEGAAGGLRRLSLFSCGLGDAGIVGLAEGLRGGGGGSGASLAELSVGWNGFGAEAAANLLGAVSDLRQEAGVAALDLSCNRLGPKAVVKFAEVLRGAHCLRSLDLRWTSLGEESLLSLLEAAAAATTPVLAVVRLEHVEGDAKVLEKIAARLRRKGGPRKQKRE